MNDDDWVSCSSCEKETAVGVCDKLVI